MPEKSYSKAGNVCRDMAGIISKGRIFPYMVSDFSGVIIFRLFFWSKTAHFRLDAWVAGCIRGANIWLSPIPICLSCRPIYKV